MSLYCEETGDHEPPSASPWAIDNDHKLADGIRKTGADFDLTKEKLVVLLAKRDHKDGENF